MQKGGNDYWTGKIQSMRRFIFLFGVLILLAGTSVSFAQTDDFGIWMSVGAEKKIDKWTFELEQELRTMENSGEIERIGTMVGLDYKLLKPLKVGLSYQFITLNDLENEDMQPRHRINMYAQGKYEWHRFTFSLRERFQLTYKDETERTYKMNPKWSLRSKLKIDYNIPDSPISPFVSFESFYQLNNPDKNKFDGLRYSAGGRYKINKHHGIELFGLVDKEINTKNPVQRFVLGTAYVYSF
ncbi:MAG: hypothetical protein A2W90_13010 [Bacteroidetes bacterium GWF2_42_66]|nr:MAG: hypothetical protein A2W92_19480 [Bacteroidetes bacterium GWA2_42_15]OFY00140.1 MAG: hypothetical protein A2W89_18000 [Bacteroidetes bacterium GWE2_42_39]OFY40282.1 MAG: hypothetical protein A2W90_13010 [Bacteroidetes bacterium GWF2_42_66]HBL73737.1 hypothetical protein [Prolixibacteraceae bacterium]HCR91200.1 hypothetical protein [Prolixibacteraceae bacterium]